MSKINTAYLFDVDGVLTDPREKRVIETELFTKIIVLLRSQYAVCLNTGRSTGWIKKQFISPLLDRITDKKILGNFFVIGEKGGAWITFSGDGSMIPGIDKAISVPEKLNEKVSQLINEKYSEAMFFDDSKKTMISIEMHDGYDLEQFHKWQTELIKDLENLLKDSGQTGKYNIDPTIIATDIENPQAGKARGADLFLEFLRYRAIKADRFIAFGDSVSDLEMTDELYRKRQKVEFIFVGDPAKLGEVRKGYPIQKIGGFSKGTLEYLQQH